MKYNNCGKFTTWIDMGEASTLWAIVSTNIIPVPQLLLQLKDQSVGFANAVRTWVQIWKLDKISTQTKLKLLLEDGLKWVTFTLTTK